MPVEWNAVDQAMVMIAIVSVAIVAAVVINAWRRMRRHD